MATAPALPPPRSVIPARPLVGGEGARVLIPLDHIAYFFLGSAVQHGLIKSGGVRGEFRSTTIYLRTAKGGLFRTDFRSLTEVLARVHDRFAAVHQSLVVNLGAIWQIDTRRRSAWAGVRLTSEIDRLRIARRRVGPLLEGLGLPT
jgi:hypothetical protein